MLRNTKSLKRASSVAYSVFRLALLIAIGYIVIYPVIYMHSLDALRLSAVLIKNSPVFLRYGEGIVSMKNQGRKV